MEEILPNNGPGGVRRRKDNRSATPSVHFEDGYAKGWFMAVGECFRGALDLEKSLRVLTDPLTLEKREVQMVTEGNPPLYSFSPGDLIHNTKKMDGGRWGDALPNVRASLQVARAVPDKLGADGSVIQGNVVARLFRRANDGSRIEFSETLRISQREFVRVLRTGDLPNGSKLF